MLNLLLISDSPKAEYIKSVLQPVLKVIVNVVTDFDHGLKDVFEKRPSVICIQDQIGGVTGESVARHIQMLLGDSAPTFILLHAGNENIKAINGLYEHLIDLSQSDDAVAEEIKKTLKFLLGDQWGKVYIPPKPEPVSVESPTTVIKELREEVDTLEDSFSSDLELSEDAGKAVESCRAETINDEMAELLPVEVDKVCRDESPVAESAAVSNKLEEAIIDEPKHETAELKPSSPVITEPLASPEVFTGVTPLKKVEVYTAVFNDSKLAKAPVVASSTPPAAEFRISQNANQIEEHFPEELLLAFEENYRSEPMLLRRTVVIVLVCAICFLGGWYLVKQNSQIVSSLTQRFLLSSGAKQSPVTVPVAVVVPSVQKTVTPPEAAQPTAPPPLPAFIPKEGHDSTYAVKNPGWERYIGESSEYRVFSASGRILAVQVLAIKNATISEILIKSILQELVGSQDYLITSRNTKANVHVENGKIQNKGEVKIYRKNGSVMAFVVSVN